MSRGMLMRRYASDPLIVILSQMYLSQKFTSHASQGLTNSIHRLKNENYLIKTGGQLLY